MSRSVYQPDPTLADVPLRRSELEEILQAGGKGVVKNTRNVLHILERALITVDRHAEDRRGFQARIEDLTYEQSQMRSGSGAMDPELALQYIPTADLARIVGGRVNELASSSESTVRRARSVIAHTFSALTDLADSPLTDPGTAAEIRQIRDAMGVSNEEIT